METKTISSTIAQNNFGRILDDVVQNNTRYIVKRRTSSQVIMLSLADFQTLLRDAPAREAFSNLIHDLSPTYNLGEPISNGGANGAE